MFRIILITSIFLNAFSAKAFDTTKVLRYTEAVSEKMEFPSVFIRFNGDFSFSDEDMATFTVEEIKENYIQILKKGGMNEHLYTLKIFNGKKGKYLVAINLRSGTDGSCQIKCFQVVDQKDYFELFDYPKGIYNVKYEDLGINSNIADLMRQNPSLIYLGYKFGEEQEITANINMNAPFGKENQEILEKITDAYPGILKTTINLNWDRKKRKFVKP